MAFTTEELTSIQKEIEPLIDKMRPREEVRSELDIGCRLEDQSVTLMEIRPRWDRPDIIMQTPFAKATFVRTQNCWKIYWMRASGKWEAYDPLPESDTLTGSFAEVERDPFGCFKG